MISAGRAAACSTSSQRRLISRLRRRLRSGDGVYYTKFGARKVAHYVEREIQRSITNRGMPVALPMPVDPGPQAPNAKPEGPVQRPLAGPVVPLTAMQAASEELIGSGRAAPAADATASRVLTKGETVAAPTGRADDFSWPRGSVLNVQPSAADLAAAPPPAPPPDASDAKPTKPAAGQRASDSTQANASSEQKPEQRRPRRPQPWNPQRSPFFFQNFFR